MDECKPLLHGAAVSMCAPRVVAVTADFIAAAMKPDEEQAVVESLRHLRNAVVGGCRWPYEIHVESAQNWAFKTII